MTRRRELFKRGVGVFAIVAVIIGTIALLQMTQSSSGLTEVSAEFESVLGLVPQAEVTVAGATVGEVSEINTTEDGMGASLTLAIEPEVAATLTANASVQLRLKSMLGELYLDVEQGTSDKPLSGGVIKKTGTDTTLDEMLGALGGTLGDVKDTHLVGKMVKQISDEFEGQGEAMQSIAVNSTELIKAISFRADSIGRIINNIDILTQSLDGRSAALGEAISSGARALEELRGSLSENVETMDNTVRQLKTTLESIETSPINQGLSEIPLWLDKIDGVIATLEDLIEGRKPIAAVFASLPEDPEGIEHQLRVIAKNPIVREALISMLESACPTPDSPGCGAPR